MLSQGKSYPSGANLEIKLYIKVEGEEVKSGAVTVYYDVNSLELTDVKPWNLFTLDSDRSQGGMIKLEGTTNTAFSGEAPFAYLYFSTLKSISNLSQALSVNAVVPTSVPSTPVPTQTTLPTQTPVPNQTAAPTQTPTSTNSPTELPNPTMGSDLPNCPNIEGSGNFAIVLLPDSYTTLGEFETDAKQAVQYMLDTNLPKAGLNKFTFRYSTDVSKDYRIKITPQALDLNVSLARLMQQECDADAFVILSNKYGSPSESFGVGGYSVMGGRYSVILSHSLFVLAHELSHALASVFDEYNFGVKADIPANYFNCSPQNQSRCQEWRTKYPNDPQIQCLPICGYTDWFRSTEFSAMNNNPNYMNYFNPPSIEMWNTFFAGI